MYVCTHFEDIENDEFVDLEDDDLNECHDEQLDRTDLAEYCSERDEYSGGCKISINQTATTRTMSDSQLVGHRAIKITTVLPLRVSVSVSSQ